MFLHSVRPHLAAIVTLIVLSALVGFWPLTGVVTAFFPVIAVPAAAGLPFLIPPLRFAPVGDSTWAFWAVDTIAVVVMVVIVVMRLVNARRRHPQAGAGRAFFSAWSATILGVVVGNLLRGIFTSFVVHADIGTYFGYLLANVLVSALFGAIFGIPVGAAAAVARTVRAERRAVAEHSAL